MQRPLEDSSEFERLKEEVRALERRLACLEGQRNSSVPEVSPAASLQADSIAGGVGDAFAMPDVAAVAGRAVLGIAGAYLLRALAETSVAPRLAVVIAAIAYSGLWLFLAWRERAGGKTAPFVYGATAAMILAPLLWEATVRFGLLPNLVTAALLVGLPALSGILGVAGWPAVVASSATAIALMVQTGDLLPFVVAVLLIAALAGFAGSPGLRAVAAVAANASVLLLIWIAAHPGDSYRPVGAVWIALCCCALPLILAAGPAKRRHIAIPEICFIGASLALVVYGAPPVAAGILLLGACLVCARFAPKHPALEICALPAGLAATWLLCPAWVTIILWCTGSVLLSRIPRRIRAFHSVALLTGAAIFASQSPLAVVLIGISAGLAWWFSGAFVWPRVLFGSLAVAAPGILLSGFSGAGTHVLPTIQTLYLCATSLAVSYSARRSERQELLWIGYGLLAVAALKLLMVDFRESPPAMLAIALVSFGAALIIVPRLRRPVRLPD